MAIDNSTLISSLLPSTYDGDSFYYTELIDRSTNKRNHTGDTNYRLLRSFEHETRDQLLNQMPMIKKLCDTNSLRAYIRLSPRSRKQVAWETAQSLLKHIQEGHYNHARYQYASACGRTRIKSKKLWLYDVDDPQAQNAIDLEPIISPYLVAKIPSRQGYHLIVRPHHVTYRTDISLHKDNPTNLYIPNEAI